MKRYFSITLALILLLTSNTIIASDNSKTSAYDDWLAAKDQPEAGEAYDNDIIALGHIKEGQRNGKIGTPKYKAALNLLIPEGQAVKKYIRTLERYLIVGSDGLQNFIDDMHKYAFLEDGDDDKYYASATANIEDIANKLNLKEQIVIDMFDALKDYGWEMELQDTTEDWVKIFTDLWFK